MRKDFIMSALLELLYCSVHAAYLLRGLSFPGLCIRKRSSRWTNRDDLIKFLFSIAWSINLRDDFFSIQFSILVPILLVEDRIPNWKHIDFHQGQKS